DHGRQQQGGEQHHQRIAEVGGQVEERFGLHVQGNGSAQDARQALPGNLRQAFGPARLLRLERVHFDGKLGRTLHVDVVNELPAAKLRTVGEVGIFGQRVVLPAAGVFDRFTAPHAGRAVEIKEAAFAIASAVLHHKVAVEQDGFNLCERGVVAVNVRPARLDHADLRILEVRDGTAKEVGVRLEIRVEDGDELAGGGLHAFTERAGL